MVLNNEINSAREVSKTDAQRLQTFKSGAFGVLGVVDDDQIVYYRQTNRRHTHRTEFDISTVDRLPRVDILMTYLDAPGDLIRAAIDAGAEGLVIAAAGAGSTTRAQRDAFRPALETGLPVVITTRTGGGRIPPRQLPRNQEVNQDELQFSANRISGEDLAPLKARILLMLALTETRDGAEIQRMFGEY